MERDDSLSQLAEAQRKLATFKTDLKEQTVLNEQLTDENRALKEMQRQADTETKRLKSDCAETLINKERLTQ